MNPLTVSALTTHIVALFERDDTLRDVGVLGEVSNWKRASSGHIYFSMKDSGATLTAVMWRNAALSHSWLPHEGDQIIAFGYVGVYPERGAYQLYVNRIQPAGRGQLYVQFEALKAKLELAGLFDAARKRTVRLLHGRIGIVTSRNAAALHDILRVIAVRWPLQEIVLFPCLVQGSEAPGQIADMVRNANGYHANHSALDLLIVARGGGSIEDLWAFNDERVAYAIFESEVPVITGIGHETDFTIADFVADIRAPTPSAAAAMVTPDQVETRLRLANTIGWMGEQIEGLIDGERRQLHSMEQRLVRLHPQRMLDQRRQQLDERERRLHLTVGRRMDRLQERVAARNHQLEALNPSRVLGRGYSIVQHLDERVVTGPSDLAPNERLQVAAAKGSYAVIVAEQELDPNQEKAAV
ncbi:MAG: exodeoxyribonuclease VII large subunit [Caldilineaceae bacterium]|nr:exodeoxyribonuclease VII large subunit [Caldilineaceae bacterium]